MKLLVMIVQPGLAQLNNMNENPDITLELTLNEINAILNAIQELPAKFANPLTAKITEQAKQQISDMQPAVAEADPETVTEVKASYA